MPKSPDMVRAEAEYSPPESFEENWLVEEEGVPLGLAVIFDPNSQSPIEWLEGDILVDSSQEATLVPGLIACCLESAKKVGAKRVGLWTVCRMEESNRILESMGFERNQVAPVSRLDLKKPVPERLRRKAEMASAAGLRSASIAELEAEGFDWKRKLYEATGEMRKDMPTAESVGDIPFEHYERTIEDESLFRRDLMFAMLDGDRIVAYNRVLPSAREDTVLTGMTGVVRSHRRRGLATALKVASIDLMASKDKRFLVTDNDDRNPMYQLNLELGFEKVFEFWRYNYFLK